MGWATLIQNQQTAKSDHHHFTEQPTVQTAVSSTLRLQLFFKHWWEAQQVNIKGGPGSFIPSSLSRYCTHSAFCLHRGKLKPPSNPKGYSEWLIQNYIGWSNTEYYFTKIIENALITSETTWQIYIETKGTNICRSHKHETFVISRYSFYCETTLKSQAINQCYLNTEKSAQTFLESPFSAQLAVGLCSSSQFTWKLE